MALSLAFGSVSGLSERLVAKLGFGTRQERKSNSRGLRCVANTDSFELIISYVYVKAARKHECSSEGRFSL